MTKFKKYRKIDPRIWNDAKFMAMSNNGKLAFLYVLTHPHMTSLGAIRSTISGLANEFPEIESKFFNEPFAQGMLKVDKEAPFIWAPNFLLYNPPESPNVVKGWVFALNLLPECESKTQLISRAKAYLKSFGAAFAKAFDEDMVKPTAKPTRKTTRKPTAKPSRKTTANQEQEQEQEQDNRELVKNTNSLWRKEYKIYKKNCLDAYNNLLDDPDWICEQQKYNPNIDIKLTLEKALNNYWLTEEAWNKKRKQKIKSINWKSTFANALTNKLNRVYLPAGATSPSSGPAPSTYGQCQDYERRQMANLALQSIHKHGEQK